MLYKNFIILCILSIEQINKKQDMQVCTLAPWKKEKLEEEKFMKMGQD